MAVDTATVAADVLMNLKQNGFAKALDFGGTGWKGNSIPFQQFGSDADKESIEQYLSQSWLGRGWVNVSRPLSNAIVGQVWEIFANAMEHSGSSIGTIVCGQRFPQRRKLVLSVLDLGRGIPANARSQLHGEPTDKDCLKWAFERGTSSADTTDDVSRGIGLDLLKEFVSVTGGRLQVYSASGYARMDRFGAHFRQLNRGFDGTLVSISVQCDENAYLRLAEEPDETNDWV